MLKQVSIGDMQPDETIESVHEASLLSKLDNPYILKSVCILCFEVAISVGFNLDK